MPVLVTERLSLRRMVAGDAPHLLELLNEPGFLRNIGDRGVRSIEDASWYIANGPGRSYAQHGFGLYLVELVATGDPIGICGLIKRDSLDDVDLGFAFFERCWSKGYCTEAAAATMVEARQTHGLRRVVAITAPDNHGSIRVLEKIGFRFEKMIRMPGEDHDINLLSWSADGPSGP
jgi:RimJ/RimL family protein N-acetyltransferase